MAWRAPRSVPGPIAVPPEWPGAGRSGWGHGGGDGAASAGRRRADRRGFAEGGACLGRCRESAELAFFIPFLVSRLRRGHRYNGVAAAWGRPRIALLLANSPGGAEQCRRPAARTHPRPKLRKRSTACWSKPDGSSVSTLGCSSLPPPFSRISARPSIRLLWLMLP